MRIIHGYPAIQFFSNLFPNPILAQTSLIVNQFKVEEELTLERLKVDPAIELGQKTKLKELRGTRDQRLVEESLEKLKVAVGSTENLMPLFIECVENDITLGEICNTLRVVWGDAKRVAEGF